MALTSFHLFAGGGGGILADILLRHLPVGACEIESYPREILLQRQRDGFLPEFPIWDDIRTFDGKPWRGLVDIVAGGFPCQDISIAGKGAGIEGAKSGIWKEMARVVGEIRPRFVFVENSPMLIRRGLATVLGDFAQMRYDAEWRPVAACEVGADHKRERLWLLATDTYSQWESQQERVEQDQRRRPCDSTKEALAPNAHGKRCQEYNPTTEPDQARQSGGQPTAGWGAGWRDTEPKLGRMVHGLANGMDRIKALGNGQVPQCAALAWKILTLGGPE